MGEAQLQVFTWETGNHLLQSYYTSPEQVWLQRFDDLQANLYSAPGACSYLNEGHSQIHVFARGHNNHLYQTFYDGQQWFGWFDLSDGPLASAPCAVQYLNNGQLQLHVFTQGPDNHLWQMYYDRGQWLGWFDLSDGPLASAPCAVQYVDNGQIQLHVFMRGQDNHLYQMYYDGHQWQGWFDRSDGPLASAPCAVQYLNNGQLQLHVFWRGPNDHLYQMYYAEQQWLGKFDLSDGPLASAPCAAQYVNDGQYQLHVFMQGPDNHLWQRYYNGNQWQGWFDFGGHLLGSPSVTAYEQEAFQPTNVAISTTQANTDGDEPMIAVHGQDLLVSWNMATATGSARIAWSNDLGDTWSIGAAQAPGGISVGSDSSVTSDPTGTYRFHLSLLGSGGGQVFAAQSSAVSDWSWPESGVKWVTNTLHAVDRPFISARDNIVAVAWWDQDLGQILSARSDDGGGNWQPPIQVSHNTTSNPYRWGSIPIVASSQEVFVAWNDGRPASHGAPAGSIYVAQWDAQRRQFHEWPVDSRYNDLTPELTNLLNVNLGPAFARNSMTGELYLAWQDNRFTERNKGLYDIVFTRWTPGRDRHWLAPVRVSEVSGAFNYFPWLSCAPNGRLDLVFYSRRLDPQNRNNDVFYTFSIDGGRTWSRALRITEQSFTPPYDQNGKYIPGGLADYICCASDNQHAYIVWGDTRVPPNVSPPSPSDTYVWFARATPEIVQRGPMP